MPATLASTRPRWIALRRLLAALAVVAQVAIVLSAIGEGRAGIGAAPHVEASGSGATHYAHDEARCAACQARSLHGTALLLPSATPGVLADHGRGIGAPVAVPAAPALPTNPARAPPSVI